MKVGYARVSTYEQTLNLQIDALKGAGCEKIFSDEGISGMKGDRPGLNQALEYCRKGDSLVIWRLDRLGRSLKHLIDWLAGLENEGVEFTSLTEAIDTTTPMGRCMFHVAGAFAQLERDLISERTLAGLAAARARGRRGGRHKVLNQKKIDVGVALADARKLTIEEICEQLDCSRATYYRHIAPLLKRSPKIW